jgi:hypothetical protein
MTGTDSLHVGDPFPVIELVDQDGGTCYGDHDRGHAAHPNGTA